jgi:hypothetical protein
VIDGADVLEVTERNHLFMMLQAAEVPALVAMTLNKREVLPDLGAAGLGGSWWMQAGVATRVGEEEAGGR